MKRTRWFLVTCLSAAALVGLPFLAGQAAAFQKTWTPGPFVNVDPTQAFFFDDVPSGASGFMGNEAGFIGFRNNYPQNEQIVYSSTSGLPVRSAYGSLQARAVVSDGALLRVGYGTSATGPCTYYPPSLTFVGPPGSSLYVTKWYSIPTTHVARKICVMLTDTPDTAATGTSTALIDYIWLRSTTGVGWAEHFAGTP